MSWSLQVNQEVLPILNKIKQHPFVHELMNGTLAKERFEFYIQQDALYLAEYGRILSIISGKLENPAQSQAFLEFAKDSVLVEKALHEIFIKKMTTNKSIKASPTCLFYTSYLHSLSNNKSIYELLAGVLPCFWIYKQVGDYILKHQDKKDNPYQAWIDTYAGQEFGSAVKIAIDICDEMANNVTLTQQKKMTEAYIMASKMEWLFWDSAYRLETWPI